MKANPKFYDAVPPEDDNTNYDNKFVETRIDLVLEKYPQYSIDIKSDGAGFNAVDVKKIFNGQVVMKIDNRNNTYAIRYACYGCVKNPSELQMIGNEICEVYNKKSNKIWLQ